MSMKRKVNPRTVRIKNITKVRTAYIMWKDIPIATISEERNDADERDWVFRPNYKNIEKARATGGNVFIPGIDLDLHKKEYIRNYVPAFVEERTIPLGRPDLYEMMDRIRLPQYDLFEFMCRTHSACGNNDLYVSRTPDKVIDVNDPKFPFDVPEDTRYDYDW